MSSVSIKNLVYTYPDNTTALSGISFSVSQGESLGIVGANGAGKSTLVNHLNGYILPQHGSIVINGTELTKKSAEEIRKVVGVVFQNPDDQLFMARLYDDIVFGPQNLGLRADEIAQKTEKLLRDFNLWELREKPPSHLSQGQKRFAALAAVLVMEPSILVMDEPTSDLDPRNRRKLITLLNSLPITRITVSHDLDFIYDTCERTIVLADGKVVADGLTSALLSDNSLLQRHGLELPIKLQ